MSQRGGGGGGRGGGRGRGGQDYGDGGGRGGRGRGERGGGGGGRGRGEGGGGGRGRGEGGRGRGEGGRGRGEGGGRGRGRGSYQESEPRSQQGAPYRGGTQQAAFQPPASAWGPPKAQSPAPQEQQAPWLAPAVVQQQQQQPQQQQQAQQQQQGGGKQKKQQQQQKKPPQQKDTSSAPIPSLGASGGGDQLTSQLKKAPGGTKGRKVEVLANHFALSISKNLNTVYQYDVTIDPDRPKNQMRLVMEEFRRKMYPNIVAAFDGKKILFTAKPLPNEGSLEAAVKLVVDEREKEYKVAVKYANTVDMGQIAKFYDQVKRGEIVDVAPITMQVIDVVLRHTLCLRQISVGRSLFSIPKGATIRLGNGMHMYRGMFQSAILGGKPFLNVDVSNKAFPAEMNVIDIIKDFGNDRNQIDVQRKLDGWVMQQLSKFMRSLKIVYEIPRLPSSRRIYRVNSATSNSQEFSFQLDNGRKTTIMEYFSKEKNYKIQYPFMPVLHVGAKDSKIYLPCELCKVMPGQAVNRKCDADQTRNMIRECARDTNYRKQGIMYNVGEARYNEDQVIKGFGLSVAGDMEKVTARILQPPSVRYQRGPVEVRKGVWNAQQFYRPANIQAGWTILILDRNVRPQEIQRFIETARKTGQSLGVSLEMVKDHQVMQLPRNRELPALEEYFDKVKKARLDLVVVVLPNQDYVYNLVKKASEISVGCLTQCIKSYTFTRKMNEMTMKNILLKVNAKLNGSNHIANTPPGIMKAAPTMLMGADVTHPAPDVENGFSVAAVTASFDPSAFKYNICWRLQQPTQEMIDDMEAIAREQLMFFFDATKGMKPAKIIMFRDGVSTGQFDAVLSYELMAIQRACARLQPDYKPAITFVVVQKRHHTRFFPVDPRISEDKNMNVPAGTVVDTTIVHPSRQDFYMVSHASIQGVAKPTKYVTLWDDNNISDDDMEELTYYLCHMFARCTRSVSYPAPTYYAHLAAARGKVYCDTQEINVKKLDLMEKQLAIKKEIVKELPMFFV